DGAVAGLTISIPVAQLKSGESGLDKNMRKALKAERFPDIVFVMSGYQVAAAPATLTVAGELTVAGVKRPETLKASLRFQDGHAVIDGEQPLQMTDFGVKPPSFMMGALKTKDRVAVKFHLELELIAPQTKAK